MQIRTRLFDKKPGYGTGQLASILGISSSQVYRIKCGKRKVSATFVANALYAFSEYKFEDLFYIVRG